MCMSDLKITSLEEINKLTLREFHFRMWALELDVLRSEFERYKLAFAIRDAAATKNVGTEKNPDHVYHYQTANDILDYEVNYRRILEGKSIEFANENDEVSPNENALLQAIANANKRAISKGVE